MSVEFRRLQRRHRGWTSAPYLAAQYACGTCDGCRGSWPASSYPVGSHRSGVGL